MAELHSQLDQLQAQANSNQASYVADEVKIRDLQSQMQEQIASIERTRETDGASHEVHDLMTARNLHIIDVFDTNENGKTSPVFGRIFFTENRKLLFYAYDLNESRLKDAKFTYHVWGEKPGQSAKALGIFFTDDKAQKRWVFKYDDPKVLSQIDSVFVTLEPAAKTVDSPRGQRLMYAYLRGEVNHP